MSINLSFKKVAGGSDVGNALRDFFGGISNKYLGGNAGTSLVNVFNPRPGQQPVYDERGNLIGYEMVNNVGILDRVKGFLNQQATTISQAATGNWLKRYWWVLVVPGGVIAAVLIFFRKKIFR